VVGDEHAVDVGDRRLASARAASTMKRPRAAEIVISESKSIAPPANRATNSP
jgi:hypothetical protein